MDRDIVSRTGGAIRMGIRREEITLGGRIMGISRVGVIRVRWDRRRSFRRVDIRINISNRNIRNQEVTPLRRPSSRRPSSTHPSTTIKNPCHLSRSTKARRCINRRRSPISPTNHLRRSPLLHRRLSPPTTRPDIPVATPRTPVIRRTPRRSPLRRISSHSPLPFLNPSRITLLDKAAHSRDHRCLI